MGGRDDPPGVGGKGGQGVTHIKVVNLVCVMVGTHQITKSQLKQELRLLFHLSTVLYIVLK